MNTALCTHTTFASPGPVSWPRMPITDSDVVGLAIYTCQRLIRAAGATDKDSLQETFKVVSPSSLSAPHPNKQLALFRNSVHRQKYRNWKPLERAISFVRHHHCPRADCVPIPSSIYMFHIEIISFFLCQYQQQLLLLCRARGTRTTIYLPLFA